MYGALGLSRTMIVEFVGLPGSGKSTLRNRTADILESMGIPFRLPGAFIESHGHMRDVTSNPFGAAVFRACKNLRKAGILIEVGITSPRLVSFTLRLLISDRRALYDSLLRLRLFLTSLTNRRFAQKGVFAQQLILFDEGVVQRAFTIFADGNRETDPKQVRYYARKIPLPDLLVYLKVDPTVMVDRIRLRPRGLSRRFRRMDEDRIASTMNEAQHMLDNLVEEIRNTAGSGVSVVCVNANNLERAAVEFEAKVIPLLVSGVNRLCAS